MSHDHNFQKIWEFRRRDDDIDSSADDSKTSSRIEPVQKKHKLVSALILAAGNDEISDTPECQLNDQPESGEGVHFELGKDVGLTRKRSGMKNKTKRGSMKGHGIKKRKCSTLDPVSLNDLKIFTESILQDLKVERENMFARMREEMRKLVDVKSITKPTRKNKAKCMQKAGQARQQKRTNSDMKTLHCNGGALEKSIISSRKTQNCSKVLEEGVKYDQAIQTIRSNEKDKGQSLRLLAKKSMYSSTPPDQIGSSSYLTLPSVISERQVEQQRIESSSRNCIKPGVARNDTGATFDRENLVINSINHHGYFSGIQAKESFGSLAQMGSKNMSCYDQTSSMGTGFPIPLHQRLDNTFNTSHQFLLENSSQGNSTLGLRMNGGAIRFSGNGRAFSDNFAANNFHGRVNNKTDGELAGYGTQDVKDGHFYLI